MKVRITIGDVEIRTEDLDLTKRQIVDLLRELAGIAVLTAGTVQSNDEHEPRSVIGFTAHLEREPTELAESYYDDEE
jgi:hypothetical protein